MTPGLITIVIPAYRARQYLRDTLGTIARQTYASWEVVVVEDGEPDGTEALVREFSGQAAGRRVLYLRHETNQGPSAARNTALAEARGEFVALLDADDLWRETHLEAAVDALRRHDADVAYSTALMFEDGTGHLIGLWGPTRERLKAAPRALRTFPGWLLHRNFITPSATVLRRRVFEVIGGFDTTLRASEDLDLWLRGVRAGMAFVHVPGCHCMYRKANAGATGNLAVILCRQAYVLAKHLGMRGVPPALHRRQAVYFHVAAGVFNLDVNPRKAAEMFFAGWRLRPFRLDLLLLAAASRFLMPWLPNLGLVRRIKRSQGY
ncbi:MAG: glycosyltransferase family 2 protein [Patescibacteria group bacterium]|nr:glycosyltransferase family 2 protein [Patescibacteria group bacterium]